jgi:hypothetical protein
MEIEGGGDSQFLTEDDMRFLKNLAVAAVICLASPFAMANTVASTDPDCNIAAGVEHLFTVTATTVNKCLYASGGNINGGSGLNATPDDQAMFDAGWTFIDLGSLFSFTGLGTTSGTFTIDASAYLTHDFFAIGLKSGDNFVIDHAIFDLANGTLGGSWTISPEQGGALSHMVLWTKGDGGCCTNEVPEPGTAALAGLALVVAGLARRRKQQ